MGRGNAWWAARPAPSRLSLSVCYSQLDEGFPENGHPPQLRAKVYLQVTIQVPKWPEILKYIMILASHFYEWSTHFVLLYA